MRCGGPTVVDDAVAAVAATASAAVWSAFSKRSSTNCDNVRDTNVAHRPPWNRSKMRIHTQKKTKM